MIIFVVIMNNIVHNKMDFTKAIVDDIIKYYILSIGRDVHHLIMCKSVNKILYKIVSDILSSCSFFKNFSYFVQFVYFSQFSELSDFSQFSHF